MPCCGQQNTQFQMSAQTTQQTHRSVGSPLPANYRYSVFFEYIGPTGLTVVGSATNKKYRFERTGSRVEIDLRDRPSLAQVPNLREVKTLDGI